MSKTKTENGLVRILTYIFVILLLIGLLGAVVTLLRQAEGMYIEYNGEIITSDNSGIYVEYSQTETAAFTISNSDGWGAYSVGSCTVKVVNNISTSSAYNFEYTVDGTTALYSYITDFTNVFSTDGGEIIVSSDGTFELMFKYGSMSEILEAYEGAAVTIDGSPDICSYPYFAIEITSPDESTVITIPFTFDVSVFYVNLSSDGVTF